MRCRGHKGTRVTGGPGRGIRATALPQQSKKLNVRNRHSMIPTDCATAFTFLPPLPFSQAKLSASARFASPSSSTPRYRPLPLTRQLAHPWRLLADPHIPFGWCMNCTTHKSQTTRKKCEVSAANTAKANRPPMKKSES